MLPIYKLDRTKLDVEITKPFFIFEIKNFFPEPFINALKNEFPDKTFFSSSHDSRGGKSYLTNRMPLFNKFIESAPSWAELYEHFCTPDVATKLYDLTHSVASERPQSQTRQWQLVVDPGQSGALGFREKMLARLQGKLGGYTPVRIGFELSHLEDGCYIPPHTDIAKKLISLMIYFPDDGVDYDQSAGTEFYCGRNKTPAWDAWKVGMLPDNEAAKFYAAHENFYVSTFEPNKLVGFVKSSNSWHGLRLLRLPHGAARRSININFFLV